MVTQRPAKLDNQNTGFNPTRINIDGLFGHLCSSTGLYSKETFHSLYSCITRMIRDHRLEGIALTRSGGDDTVETLAHALDGLPHLTLHRYDNWTELPESSGLTAETGFLLVLSNRMCATLFWTRATYDSFRMYEGGWTFHPGDTKTMAGHMVSHIGHAELLGVIEETPVDRRYDDKLNVLITSLVHGLENRNRELTIALDQVKNLNQRVIESERLAAIGQLSSVIAHEIRNPLGLIDLYAKLTEDLMAKLTFPEESAKQHETLLKNLDQIRQATQGLETILSELTNYSRPLQLNLGTVDIESLVRDVCEFYRPSYDQKGVQLALTENGTGALNLQADRDKIRQALINLLKNALEASKPETTVTVTVANRQTDQNVYVKVADEGAGIEPQIAKKLFTPYFSTKGNGTGLGLAHSRKILQAHGGRVELLSSTPGQGSTFALILPKTNPES